MEYGVPVFVLNWWQSKSAAEMEYRKTPLELLAKFNIHFHSYSAQYTRYLEDLDFAIELSLQLRSSITYCQVTKIRFGLFLRRLST